VTVTHIKITTKHTGDERWLEAGADAWAVHCWALTYCDDQTTDGRISRAMAERLALPVPPSLAGAAVDKLLELGLWEDAGDALQVADYDTYGLLSGEITQTRNRWATDKRMRRKHSNGVHDECDPKKCPIAARMSYADIPSDATLDNRSDNARTLKGVSAPIPDQTRPDPTSREGKGSGRGQATEQRSAGATRSTDAGAEGDKPAPHDFPYDELPDSGETLEPTPRCPICGLGEFHMVHMAHDFVGAGSECGDCGALPGSPDHTWHHADAAS
jgi:hypothetical protein